MIVSDSEKAATHFGAKRILNTAAPPAGTSNITGLTSNASPSNVTPAVANDCQHAHVRRNRDHIDQQENIAVYQSTCTRTVMKTTFGKGISVSISIMNLM